MFISLNAKFWGNVSYIMGFPGGSDGKESSWNVADLGSIPWRRKWQPTPVSLPGEFHGQRSLVGYSLWGLGVRYN